MKKSESMISIINNFNGSKKVCFKHRSYPFTPKFNNQLGDAGLTGVSDEVMMQILQLWLGFYNLFQTFEELDDVKDISADNQSIREVIEGEGAER